MKKFSLRLTGGRIWYFLIFAFSLYLNFKWLLSEILQWILRVLGNFYYVTNIFDLHICKNETATLLIFFEICTDMHFVSLFFSKWKQHYNLPVDDTFKMYCCALCWLKFKLQKEALLKLRVVEYAISFFLFLIYVYFNEALVKIFMK